MERPRAVKVLLDTNVVLWCITGQTERLSRRAARVIEREETELLLSAASLWEIVLKARAGKLELPEEEGFLREHMGLLGVKRVLPVEASHVFGLFALPDYHRDPFDRLLVAQCMVEKIALVASDGVMGRYPVEIVW